MVTYLVVIRKSLGLNEAVKLQFREEQTREQITKLYPTAKSIYLMSKGN